MSVMAIYHQLRQSIRLVNRGSAEAWFFQAALYYLTVCVSDAELLAMFEFP